MMNKDSKGITLIALIITIIVLLILAGVTISPITGNESAMEKAQEAAQKTKEAEQEEQIRLDEVSSKLEPEWDGTVATSFAGGDGSSTEPFIIENGAQLAYLAALVNGDITDLPSGVSDKTFNEIHVSITKSINLGNREFTPIGLGDAQAKTVDSGNNQWSTTKSFKGILNGNNKVITGLKISKKDNFGVGLIGVLETGGTVENIVVYEGNVTGMEAVGGIVGASRGIIRNCYNSATIKAQYKGETNSTGEVVGGIVGLVSNGNVQNCKNYGKVETTINPTKTGGQGKYAGGIIGGVLLTTDVVTISNCKNYASVLAEYQICGGIVGRVETSLKVKIENCENSGNVSTGTRADLKALSAGGIVGSVATEAEIINCGNSGTIIANRQVAGGIVGKITAGSITNCYNTGLVEAKSVENKGVSGGIVGGMANGIISDVYNSGTVKVGNYTGNTQDNSKNVDAVGGIVGVQQNGSISNAYNKGELIKAQDEITTGEAIDVLGGVVGQKTDGSVDKTFYYTNDSSLAGIGESNSGQTGTKKVTFDINSLKEFLNKINSL